MTEPNLQGEHLLAVLKERAKELGCLYRVEELLADPDSPLEEVFDGVVQAIPAGWQYPEVCGARIVHRDIVQASAVFTESPWCQREEIRVQGTPVGTLWVSYADARPEAAEGPFLAEERRLIRTIADRLGHFILHQDLRRAFHESQNGHGSSEPEWRVAVNLLANTDLRMYQTIARKLMHHMCWLGVREARALLAREQSARGAPRGAGENGDLNVPQSRRVQGASLPTEEIFEIAAQHVVHADILAVIHKWVHEDKASFLLKVLIDEHATLSEIADAMARYQRLMPEGLTLTKSATNNVVVALIRRFFSSQLDYIRQAKSVLGPDDFFSLLERVVFTPGSHGQLGGKSAGLFLAMHVLKQRAEEHPELGAIRVPKTWHLASDGLLEFIRYNNLEEVLDHKYKEIDRVRQEYDYIIQVFKSSRFPPEMVKGLSVALDDLSDTPLIVRSSSLLEDQSGTSFPGKYKSLFLANRGTKPERLDALLDAIAEVYASTFGPDPIEYRASRGLIDYDEQMGVMIQEVVGTRVGPYVLPLWAGVAFSKNDFRWSPRIERDDGMVRLVPGLGTRAVDRVNDDYPVLVAPGRPELRVNTTPEEIIRYAPRRIDLINLETGCFETLALSDFLREHAGQIPNLKWLVSVMDDGVLEEPVGASFSLAHKTLVVTFDGLIRRSPFMRQIKRVLEVLEGHLGGPVDIEFASDGEHVYLLQCRPQSASDEIAPSPIPTDVAKERVVFTAHRHVSNGRVPDLTHIVFVDPDGYSDLPDRGAMDAVGRAVGQLNRLLPKRQFALMGPGRWGSRGDIKLGVSVTYSDIHNAALLIEIARQRGSYVPELSFGTHFFQDLVESSIAYLPLYPDDEGADFHWVFLRKSPSVLTDLLPEYGHIESALRVIDVAREAEGRVLRVLMNGELDRAIGLLVSPEAPAVFPLAADGGPDREPSDHWQWRLRMAERLSEDLDMQAHGVKAIYVFGSTKNATARAGSDIDLLLHVEGDDRERPALRAWLEGFGRCLSEINDMRTGYRVHGMLDVHVVTDGDIARRTSFACKIGAVTDAARLVRSR